jgi:hypothetical protein
MLWAWLYKPSTDVLAPPSTFSPPPLVASHLTASRCKEGEGGKKRRGKAARRSRTAAAARDTREEGDAAVFFLVEKHHCTVARLHCLKSPLHRYPSAMSPRWAAPLTTLPCSPPWALRCYRGRNRTGDSQGHARTSIHDHKQSRAHTRAWHSLAELYQRENAAIMKALWAWRPWLEHGHGEVVPPDSGRYGRRREVLAIGHGERSSVLKRKERGVPRSAESQPPCLQWWARDHGREAREGERWAGGC